MDKTTAEVKSPLRYLRYSALFALCFLLIWVTEERAKEATDVDVVVHNKRVQKLDELVASVQKVPPMSWDNVDPERPVYLKGEVTFEPEGTGFDDPEFGVSFGDYLGATRFLTFQDAKRPEAFPEGLPQEILDLPDGDVQFGVITAEGQLKLAGATLSEELHQQLSGSTLFSGVSEREILPPSFSKPSYTAGQGILSNPKISIQDEWGKVKNKAHTYALFLDFGEEPNQVQVKVIYHFTPPRKVNYLGGYREGVLVPFEGLGPHREESILYHNALFELESAPIDIREEMETRLKGPIRLSDPLGEETVELPPEPLSYARGIGLAGSAILCLITFGLFLVVPKPVEG